ncbi:hypothetical protein HPB50_000117 [Hyalomma asiaticum]|uniref:Uncharacterized protein n=1 Tax=Hyalomma asiaticum TaxID=266040 RepID=A0ACB7TA32_HYAAI|nr:hypothetical protein HPB50_000117 [Hyalomma asiaticum]
MVRLTCLLASLHPTQCSAGVPPGIKRQQQRRIRPLQDKSKFGQHKSCRVYVGDFGNRRNRQGLEKAFGSYRPLRRVWVAQSPPGFRSSSSKTYKMHGTPCVHFTARRFVDAAYASNCRRVCVALRAATLRVSSHKRTVLAFPLARSSLRASAALTWTVRLLSVAEEE